MLFSLQLDPCEARAVLDPSSPQPPSQAATRDAAGFCFPCKCGREGRIATACSPGRFGGAGFCWRPGGPRDDSPGSKLDFPASKPGPEAAKTAIIAGKSGACQLLGAGALGDLRDLPGLGLGDRLALLDHHLVAQLGVVALVVGVVLLGAAHHLADGRMQHLALHQHGDGLVHLVAHHAPGELARVARRGLLGGFAHLALPLAFAFWLRNVCTRAIWRRTRSTSLCFVSDCVACCMRRPNCALRSSSSSLFSSSALFERSSSFLAMYPPSADHPLHEGRADRQLRGGEREGLAGHRLLHPVHLVEHLAGHDLGHEVLGRALAVAHADLGGLLGDRLVREDADPDPPAALDVAGHRTARGLDLARREAATGGGLEPELAEGDLGAAGCDALVAALLLLAVFPSSWLQHVSLPVSWRVSSRARLPAGERRAARPCR